MADPLPPGALAGAGLRILSHLHRSKHADVYRVVDEADLRERIAKIALPDLGAEAIARVHTEAWRLAHFDHANILRFVRRLDDPPGTLLELIEGPSLREKLRGAASLPWPEVARLGADLASALVAVHAAGMLHFDVKPANILCASDRYVLIDFDLARSPGTVRGGRGTREFAAPEQVAGGLVGPAADAWGLGVVLHRAASGRLPFSSKEGYPQLTSRAPPLGGIREGGGEIASVIDALLSHDPARRPVLDWVEVHFRGHGAPLRGL